MESACECVVAFCEVVLQAVIAEYQENDGNSKECLLETLELALQYLVLLEQYLGRESTLLITIIGVRKPLREEDQKWTLTEKG